MIRKQISLIYSPLIALSVETRIHYRLVASSVTQQISLDIFNGTAMPSKPCAHCFHYNLVIGKMSFYLSSKY